MNPSMNRDRLLLAAPALACAGLLGFGYYLQYFDGQDPCPLCLVQRGFFYVVLVGVRRCCAAFPGRGPEERSTALPQSSLALGGFGVAARQVWLQHLPADQVPACGPDLFYMMENFPFSRMLQKLFMGSGQCAEVHWRFLGLSIAEWSLAWFAALALLRALARGARQQR